MRSGQNGEIEKGVVGVRFSTAVAQESKSGNVYFRTGGADETSGNVNITTGNQQSAKNTASDPLFASIALVSGSTSIGFAGRIKMKSTAHTNIYAGQ